VKRCYDEASSEVFYGNLQRLTQFISSHILTEQFMDNFDSLTIAKEI